MERNREVERNLGCLVLELARLRKIEEAAQQIDDWLRDNPAAEVAWRRVMADCQTPWVNVNNSYAVFMLLLTDLRQSLETETDG